MHVRSLDVRCLDDPVELRLGASIASRVQRRQGAGPSEIKSMRVHAVDLFVVASPLEGVFCCRHAVF